MRHQSGLGSFAGFLVDESESRATFLWYREVDLNLGVVNHGYELFQRRSRAWRWLHGWAVEAHVQGNFVIARRDFSDNETSASINSRPSIDGPFVAVDAHVDARVRWRISIFKFHCAPYDAGAIAHQNAEISNG